MALVDDIIGLGGMSPELASIIANGITSGSSLATPLKLAPVSNNFLISLNTADASDTGSLKLGGGGDTTASRGSYISFFGNESASPGFVDLFLGNVNGSRFRVRGSDANSAIDFRHGGDTGARITFTATGDISFGSTLGGNIIFNQAAGGSITGVNAITMLGTTPTISGANTLLFEAGGGSITVNTADGSDSASMGIGGASALTGSRTGRGVFYGNENATNAGGIDMFLGTGTAGSFRVRGSVEVLFQVNQSGIPGLQDATNFCCGVATFSSGVATISNTSVLGSSEILITRKTQSGTAGVTTKYTVNTGTSIVVTSIDTAGATVTTDAGTFFYVIINRI